jgi:3',5'-cyclic AMP phosphodiesterase CpdA
VHTLIHISDTHILPREDDRLQGVDTLRTLEQALEYVTSSGVRPDALVVSGDLANHGELDSYRRLRPMLERFARSLDAELIVCMGNHDSRSPFREAMLDEPAGDAPIEYVRWIGGLRVIVLDSTVPGAPYGEMRPDQLDWLRTELGSPAPDGTLLVLHHPPVPDRTPLAGLLTLHGSSDLAEIVRGSDVVAVLAGHAHHAIASAFAGTLCYAAPATAYSVDPLPLEQRTLRGVEGSGLGLIRVIDRQAVALTISLPSDGRQTYRHELDDRVLSRLTGESVVAA